MNDKDLENLLKGAGDVPNCPNDKFVASFLAQMDKDLMPQKKRVVKSYLPIYGAIAACFLFAFGGLIYNQFFNSQNYANDDYVQIIDEQNPEDEFASQLVGYDDITTIVELESL